MMISSDSLVSIPIRLNRRSDSMKGSEMLREYRDGNNTTLLKYRKKPTMSNNIFDIVANVISKSKCEWATAETQNHYVAKFWNPDDKDDFNVFIYAKLNDKEYTFFTTTREVLITDVTPKFVSDIMNNGMICKTRDKVFLEQFCRLHFPVKD